MNTTLLRVPAYWLNYYTGLPKTQPINLTVSVTFDCNSRCTTCNIWRKEKQDEFSLEEFRKTFYSMSDVYWLTLSGGEPILRDDLPDIAEAAYEIIHPAIINIPTNALAKDTAKKAADVAAACPKSTVVVNVSIDGVGREDDRIRGVAGAYDAAVKTVGKLKEVKAKNLVVGVHTVISKQNVDCIPETFDAIMELEPDSYVTEVAEERVELDNIGSGVTPSPTEYSIIADFLLHEMDSKKTRGLPKITQAFRKRYYEIAKKVLREKRQVIPCYAGIASAHINPAGDVWACCVRAESIGNLRDHDYDFKRIWKFPTADKIRHSIEKGECACPLANAHYTSMLCHPPTLGRVLLDVLR